MHQAELKELQQADESLQSVSQQLEKMSADTDDGKSLGYRYKKGIIWKLDNGKGTSSQLVVLKTLRKEILGLTHDAILSGQLGVKKTSDRILGEFYWPNIQDDIRRYYASCDKCQRTVAMGRNRNFP